MLSALKLLTVQIKLGPTIAVLIASHNRWVGSSASPVELDEDMLNLVRLFTRVEPVINPYGVLS